MVLWDKSERWRGKKQRENERLKERGLLKRKRERERERVCV